jgi:transcriptional regulator with XRE-family HTH domain
MARRKTTVEGPDPIDIYVGGRVRLHRTLAGLSQERLGKAIGCSYQQLQKYESGANRLSASMLYRVAKALNLPISVLFEGFERSDSPPSGIEADAAERLSLEAVREMEQIEDMATREALRTVIRSLGARRASGGGS